MTESCASVWAAQNFKPARPPPARSLSPYGMAGIFRLAECDTCKLAMLLNKFAAWLSALLSCSHLRKRQRQQRQTSTGQAALQREAATCKIGLRCVQIRLKRQQLQQVPWQQQQQQQQLCINRRWLPRRQSAINLNDCQPVQQQQQPTMATLWQHVAHSLWLGLGRGLGLGLRLICRRLIRHWNMLRTLAFDIDIALPSHLP